MFDTYGDLANALAQISTIRAQDLAQKRQQQGPGLPWTEAYHNQMAKMWQHWGGLNGGMGGIGVAPQILDTEANKRWMLSALQDPRGFGHGAPGPQSLRTPTQRPQREIYSPEYVRDLNQHGYNSNTGLPRNWSSVTGAPMYVPSTPQMRPGDTRGTASAPPVSPMIQEAIDRLAQSPEHAATIVSYFNQAGMNDSGYGYNNGGMSPYMEE
jgi:hypothetical protein